MRDTRRVQIYYNKRNDEYTCILYINDIPYTPATYYTDDKQDAKETARAMEKEQTAGVSTWHHV